MIKIIRKIKIGAKSVRNLFLGQKNSNFKGLVKNPLFYFGLISFVLFGTMYLACNGYADSSSVIGKIVLSNSFLNNTATQNQNDLFFAQNDKIALETPDLKLVGDNTLCGISAPCVVSAKVLGDTFGTDNSNKKDVTDYVVQPGDSLKSIADSYQISVNTLVWANDLTTSSAIKVGQDLTILPTNGVLHIVKSGDTMSAIAQKYKSNSDAIISYNNLANQDDIYVGDILVIPGGVMPKKAVPLSSGQVPLANNYFIFPAEGRITQGLHYYNAIDLANVCGTPIYAAASGVVQRAVFNNSWNAGMGNYVTILHANGTVTYYGHFEYVAVKPGDKVDVGDKIGLMGRTGNATGCHVHFEVVGATNPLAKYSVGSKISYK